ncbi:MAG: vanadium-dependent haloperoxidase [Pseudomonadota bacterium]
MAALPPGAARDKGLALGAEVAAGMLARRAADGRSTVMAPYQPSKDAGKYQGATAVMMVGPLVRPFTLARADQFRPGPPPALTSAAYAKDFNETKAMGGSASTQRSEAQSQVALFHTEAPGTTLTRNVGRLARSTNNAADAARLIAAVYAVNADAIIACFDAKYHYNAWRPYTAIALADSDGNPDTAPDPAWRSSQFTPPHPEYPAAHSCIAGGLATMLRSYYGTGEVAFMFDSKVTGTTHHYANVEALQHESVEARIAGGIHFRFSAVAGDKLGSDVAAWAMQKHFQPRK